MSTRIAIPSPTSLDETYNRLSWSAYAEAVRAAGGEPVSVPLTLGQTELRDMFAGVGGVLLPGSRFDVEPAGYGHLREEDCAPADPAREAVDRYLLELAAHSGKPLLGICFGMQMINVVHGGTMIQDLAILPVNHGAGRSVAVAHTAALEQDSVLASMVDPEEADAREGQLRLGVNSSHHQAAAIPGTGLRVVGRCPQDGVIEAIELLSSPSGSGGRFLLGVQWHPERTCAESPTSRALFRRLTSEAELWRS